MKMLNIIKDVKRKHLLASLLMLAAVTLVTLGVTNMKTQETANASDDVAFFFSTDGCYTSVSTISKPIGDLDLYVCIDGAIYNKGEGTGLLGAEVHITYTSNRINVKSTSCDSQAFGVCIEDMTVSETIILLATDSRANLVNSIEVFAILDLDLLTIGRADFSFTTSDVFDENLTKIFPSGAGLTLTIVPPICDNDGIVDEGEECDGTNLNNQTCTSLGYTGGTLSCDSGCQFDESGCTGAVCNNDGWCDKAGGETETNCPNDCGVAATCNNYLDDAGEECDPTTSPNGWDYASCVEAGYGSEYQTGDDLTCTSSCTLDYSKCEGPCPNNCGNGIVEMCEQCEPPNAYNADGTYCDGNCLITGAPTSGDVCGDGKIGSGEQCEPPNTATCDGKCQIIEAQEQKTDEQTSGILSYIALTLPDHVAVDQTISANTWAYYSDDLNTPVNITSPNTNYGMSYSSSNTAVAKMTDVNSSKILGVSAGTVTITASYTTADGTVKTASQTVTVSSTTYTPPPPVCNNNGVCEGDENNSNCSGDCYCGNGVCDSDEDETTCAEDCVVDAGETDDGETNDTGAVDDDADDTGEVHPSAGPDDKNVESVAANVASTEEPLTVKYEVPDTKDNDECKQIFSDEKAYKDDDGDGLSNRTECYLGTDPNDSDTDGDGCLDGDEINQFYTNPLIGPKKDKEPDCSIEEKTEQKVLITDPQPGWIIPELRFAGIAPSDTEYVSVVVFGAEYASANTVVDALDALMTGSTSEEIEMELDELESAIEGVSSFIDTYPDYEYVDLAENMTSLKGKIQVVRVTEDDPETPENEKDQAVENNFSEDDKPLLTYKNLGYTSEFSKTALSKLAKGFKLVPDETLVDGKLYDAVAVATLTNGGTKSSGAVRFSVDSTVGDIGKPIPRSIGGENIYAGQLALGNIFINGVLAEDGAEFEIEITDAKPTISGDSQYGAQVFAIWESIVLASSVISDSEEGAFAIQAPRNLEINTGHKVTLYAVVADEDSGDRIRSDNTNVYFRVTQKAFPMALFLWIIGIAAALIILTLILRSRLKKKVVAPEAMVEEIAEEAAEEVTEAPEVTAAPVAEPEAPAEPVAEEKVEEPVEAISDQQSADQPVEEPVTEEPKEAISEQTSAPAEEKPVPPIAQTPGNPVEQDEPTSEEHTSKEEEVVAAFNTESGENKEM